MIISNKVPACSLFVDVFMGFALQEVALACGLLMMIKINHIASTLFNLISLILYVHTCYTSSIYQLPGKKVHTVLYMRNNFGCMERSIQMFKMHQSFYKMVWRGARDYFYISRQVHLGTVHYTKDLRLYDSLPHQGSKTH